MTKIFPVFVKEIKANDVSPLYDLRDLKIFIEENMDILDEFEAWTSAGRAIRLTEDILEADTLDAFIEKKKKLDKNL